MSNFFSQNKIRPWVLLSVFAIVALILWNTNILFQILKVEERTKMELWATAQQELIENSDLSRDYGILAFDVLQKIGVTPMIKVNASGHIKDFKNIAWEVQRDPDSLKLYALLQELKLENEPIAIRYKDVVNQTLYYGDSELLKKLQYYPLALLLIIALFAAVLFFFFQTSKVSEQNRLWAGMAKETAHQIGTPLSSLMGWITLLKEQKIAPASVDEMEKDVDRLSVITERFSKVGSLPELHHHDIAQATQEAIRYLKKRSSQLILWTWDIPENEIKIPINLPLYSWTLENLIKNGIDAMKGQGSLTIELVERKTEVVVCVSDTGQGIAPKNVKRIFNPGFTTKQRGWGLGLSLVRRIIVDYHQGSVAVLKTELGKGTTFEIRLKK
ncbi:MAG: HAMP domain-containing sensor histidine kinase [Flavobacteriaceae bacterium]|jgi:signal transduction histidine kinase|nr:HAMP domain-containing histidine kinase [Flavobacteriaceae bacterium]MDG1057653.1 HAMP domain-containing sensor histidine kinase [Flavobacteriaceae bacterium]MDG1090795.1 HAMP domain-containing sensor histidine kinase [Flavobacteriaceae bacterium]